MREPNFPSAVVFDVGRVLIRWDMRCLFEKLIHDKQELDWFCANVVTEEWHYQADEGRPVKDMVAERIAQYPQYEQQIRAYEMRFNETIPGPVCGTHDIVRQLADRGVPLFALTNFGEEFWAGYRPTEPLFDLFDDIVVSGVENLAKPSQAIYVLAEKRFGRRPEELFFIDDRSENVAAAKARGWHGHVFESAKHLQADLICRDLLDAK